MPDDVPVIRSADRMTTPRLLVLSGLFPSATQPGAGLFIRERMFRVGKSIPIVVVAPQAWFPLQGLIRKFRPHFRPPAERHEVMQGFEVYRPRVLCFPGILKWTDGFFMALGSYRTIRKLVRRHQLNILDVHFGYPDGYAGLLLGRWLRLPVVLTLRGKEERQARMDVGSRLKRAIRGADRLIAVSQALRQIAIDQGVAPEKAVVIGNGIDLDKFRPIDQAKAREMLGLPADAKVIVSVGTLVERKGFHRVIELLPALRKRYPNLHYLIVGGAGPEGDNSRQLRQMASDLALEDCVHFLGPYAPDKLHVPLSASNLFVLATSYEGWANVFLEAMACGLPVVSTKVGGNAQVVNADHLGTLVEFGNASALERAIDDALERTWNYEAIKAYAHSQAWEHRIPPLLEIFESVVGDTDAGRRTIGVSHSQA
jgi:glycosyltransferase involved in cell wall biosynthesis